MYNIKSRGQIYNLSYVKTHFISVILSTAPAVGKMGEIRLMNEDTKIYERLPIKI
jgi:hypothetical protein